MKTLSEEVTVETMLKHNGKKYMRETFYVVGQDDHAITWFEPIGGSWFDIKDKEKCKELEAAYIIMINENRK